MSLVLADFSHTMDVVQGLDRNSDGSIANAPDPTFRENYKNEQEDWAAQTDTRSAEIKERIVHRAGAAGAVLDPDPQIVMRRFYCSKMLYSCQHLAKLCPWTP